MTRKKNYIEEPDFLTIPDAAKLCGVTRNTVYIWARQGKLSTYKTPGRTNLIRPNDLVKFMQKSGMYVPPGLLDLARRDVKMDDPGSTPENADAKPSILVVDDDMLVRTMVVQTLDDRYPVYQAQTGYEALHLLTVRKDIRLVLLDVRMPGQVGTETFAEIKKLRPDVKILIVTGFIDDVPQSIRDDEMVFDVMEKPVDEDVLTRAVETVMPSRETV
jgi:excisionase family DNA binding protein